MGAEMPHRRSWDEGLANKLRKLRVQGQGYRTIGTKLVIKASKMRRIVNATAELA